MELLTSLRDQSALRTSFDQLAQKTFGLSFQPWYESGYWGPSYLPHAYVDQGRVVANVSVNFLTFRHNNRLRRYIQLGTVMTDPAYRRQGLSRRLIEWIQLHYGPYCDCLYLFANDSVLEFYPKFGFEKANEYERRLSADDLPQAAHFTRQLDMNQPEDRQLLLYIAMQGNPYSSLTSLHQDPGLLFFYCLQFLKDSLYYIPDLHTLVIAEYDGPILRCQEIFGDGIAKLSEILSCLCRPQTKHIHLLFSSALGEPILSEEPDTTLFVWKGQENPFQTQKLIFSPITHT